VHKALCRARDFAGPLWEQTNSMLKLLVHRRCLLLDAAQRRTASVAPLPALQWMQSRGASSAQGQMIDVLREVAEAGAPPPAFLEPFVEWLVLPSHKKPKEGWQRCKFEVGLSATDSACVANCL
jgi:hypothetical protein